MTGRLLTVAQVAAQVQLDETTVRRAIRRGELEASKPAGQIRIAADAVDRWLEETKVLPPVDVPRAPKPRAPRISRPSSGPTSGSSFRDKVRNERKAA